MHAFVLNQLGRPLAWEDRPDPEPDKDMVVVQLHAAALNRRDYWITQGLYPHIKIPVVLGSDGAGVVVAIGQNVDPSWTNQAVIINPAWDWGDNDAVQSASFRILGMPDDGTLATQVVVPAKYLHAKPAHLNWHEAAALPLAGVTAYRAVFTQGQLKPGECVLISGVGGGVATFALQYAVAVGARVVVTSSSEGKITRARELGAAAGFNYASDDWHTLLRSRNGRPNLIIDSAGGAGHANLVDLAAPGGRLVNYGSTAGLPRKFDLYKVFWRQLQIIGSTSGSPADFAGMLEFIIRHQLKPVVDGVYPLGKVNIALERMKESHQFGKIVLEMEST